MSPLVEPSPAPAFRPPPPWRPPTWIAGRWRLAEGTAREYRQLARWHYRSGPPATWCRVAVVRHERPGVPTAVGDVVAAVAVLSWPTICNRARSEVFGLGELGYGERARWANEHLRTISRVVVRPSYRGAGLARAVVAELVRQCPTPYIESSAVMGEFHPMFERCGLVRVDVERAKPYFWRPTLATAST